jgi:hypothetical protein
LILMAFFAGSETVDNENAYSGRAEIIPAPWLRGNPSVSRFPLGNASYSTIVYAAHELLERSEKDLTRFRTLACIPSEATSPDELEEFHN